MSQYVVHMLIMLHACAMRKASHQHLVTLNNAHQRNQPWPIQKSPSTVAAVVEKRLRLSTEGNKNSRREKKEIGKAKA